MTCNRSSFSAVAACVLFLLTALPQYLSANNTYTQTNLVSDINGFAAVTDPNLKNPWGMSFSATSPFWVSNQGSNTSTLYDGAGNIVPLEFDPDDRHAAGPDRTGV